MNALDHFTIPVSGLHNGLHEFDFIIEADFFKHFEESPISEANVNVHLAFDKQTDLYVMEFDLAGTVKSTCDRCLEELNVPIEDSQSLLVKFDEKEWEDAEVVYILQGTAQINVARYIYEFVNLAMPMVKTHSAAGESCDPEMLKFLSPESEEEEKPSTNPVWDSLRGFNLEN